MNSNRCSRFTVIFLLLGNIFSAQASDLQQLEDCEAIFSFRTRAQREDYNLWKDPRATLLGKSTTEWTETDWQDALRASERCLLSERAKMRGMQDHVVRWHKKLLSLWPSIVQWQAQTRSALEAKQEQTIEEEFAITRQIGTHIVQPTRVPAAEFKMAETVLASINDIPPIENTFSIYGFTAKYGLKIGVALLVALGSAMAYFLNLRQQRRQGIRHAN